MPVQITVEYQDAINGVIEDRLCRQYDHYNYDVPTPVWNKAFLTPDQERYLTAKLYSGRCKALAALDEASAELDRIDQAYSEEQREQIWDRYQAASKLSQFLADIVGSI